MKDSFYFSIISLIIFSSCNTEPTVVVSKNKKTPVSIAHNFTMTYTDSTLTKSFVSGKTHYDFTNDQLNFSEFTSWFMDLMPLSSRKCLTSNGLRLNSAAFAKSLFLPNCLINFFLFCVDNSSKL